MCDLGGVISHGLTALNVSYKKHVSHNSMIANLSAA